MANVKTHFCAGIRYRITSDGRIEFLVIEYSEKGRNTVQIKFPGGTNKGRPEEDPTKTLQREWEEEVGGEKLHSACPVHVHYVSPVHTQYFFILDERDWSGEDMRTEEMTEKADNGHRRDEVLGPPKWMSEDELRDKIFRAHGTAFRVACEWIREEHPAFQSF